MGKVMIRIAAVLSGMVYPALVWAESFFSGPASEVIIVIEILSVIVLIAVARFLWKLGKQSSEQKRLEEERGGENNKGG